MCLVMLNYVLGMCEGLYRGLASIKKCDMSENRHIVHRDNRTTVVHQNRRNKKCQTHKKKSKQNS